MRRPVRFFVQEIRFDGTLWLDDGKGEESSVVEVKSFDSMGHGRDEDRKLRVVIMQIGRAVDPQTVKPK